MATASALILLICTVTMFNTDGNVIPIQPGNGQPCSFEIEDARDVEGRCVQLPGMDWACNSADGEFMDVNGENCQNANQDSTCTIRVTQHRRMNGKCGYLSNTAPACMSFDGDKVYSHLDNHCGQNEEE